MISRGERKGKKKQRKNEESTLSTLNTLIKMIKINMAVPARKQIQKTKKLKTPQSFTDACIEQSPNRG